MRLFLYFIFFVSPLLLFGQIGKENNLRLPEGLGLANHLEYSYSTEEKSKILENWFNLDYTKGIFSTGLRFEIFQPNDPNPSVNRGKNKYADIAYKYFKVKIGTRREGLNFTIGNFYGSFGRGLILNSYEDRNVRIDNNLLGILLESNYSNFFLRALSGSSANINDERKDILHAADLEYRGIKKLKLGFSFASNISENENDAATNLLGFRITPSLSFADIYAGYALKTNNDFRKLNFENNSKIVGRGFYSNINFYYENLSILTELKYYDNFNFTSKDGTVQYNTAPAVIRDYSYILLNRHPHSLNQNNEKGFQIEGNYVFNEFTNFTISYGLTKTIGKGSLYNEALNIEQTSRNLLEEIYGQVHHAWNSNFKSILTLGYNEEATTNTKNITPIFEGSYYLDATNTIRIIAEHQLSKNNFTDEKYYSDVLVFEYLHSPDYSVSLVGEMKTSEPEKDNVKRKFWAFAQVAFKINDYVDLSLLIGSRQAGNICVGGVCRYEPEFEGVELKILTRLY